MFKHFRWLIRVSLVVTFGFLSQNFGRWRGPANGTLSFYECRFSGGDTMRWWGHSNPTIYAKKNLFELFTLTGIGDANTLGTRTHAITCIIARVQKQRAT